MLERSFLLGRSMGEAVKEERELVVSQLVQIGLTSAARATRETCSFRDFFTMRGLMLAGGCTRSGCAADEASTGADQKMRPDNNKKNLQRWTGRTQLR